METFYLNNFDNESLYLVVNKLQDLYDVTGIVSSCNLNVIYVLNSQSYCLVILPRQTANCSHCCLPFTLAQTLGALSAAASTADALWPMERKCRGCCEMSWSIVHKGGWVTPGFMSFCNKFYHQWWQRFITVFMPQIKCLPCQRLLWVVLNGG